MIKNFSFFHLKKHSKNKILIEHSFVSKRFCDIFGVFSVPSFGCLEF